MLGTVQVCWFHNVFTSSIRRVENLHLICGTLVTFTLHSENLCLILKFVSFSINMVGQLYTYLLGFLSRVSCLVSMIGVFHLTYLPLDTLRLICVRYTMTVESLDCTFFNSYHGKIHAYVFAWWYIKWKTTKKVKDRNNFMWLPSFVKGEMSNDVADDRRNE